MSCGFKQSLVIEQPIFVLEVEQPAFRFDIGQPVFILEICINELADAAVDVMGEDNVAWDLDGVFLEWV